MKILFIVPSLINVGPVLVTNALVHLFVMHGHQCKVCYFDEIKELSFDCTTERIRMSQKVDFDEYDIVHTHGYRPQLYVFLHKPWHCKSKFVTTIHSYLFDDFRLTYGRGKGMLYGLLYLLVAIRADKIVALSMDAQQYYSKFFNVNKLTYAYNTRICDYSLDLTADEKQQLQTFRGDSALLGTSCALSPLKGLDLIVQALQGCPDVKFCIVGDGAVRKEWERLAENLGVADRVLFVGYKKAAYRYLPYFDAFAIPSHSEGFPLAMLEAAAFGKPIVASNLDVFKEIFTDDEISMFDLKDKKSVAPAIRRAFLEREELSRKVKLKYETAYSPECFYGRYLEIYNEMIAE